jgi:hypothetical protein
MAASATELLLMITHEFEELRKEYTLFLNDVVKLEPVDSRDRLMKRVKILRNLTNLRTEDQFKANNLIAKVNTHVDLWNRQTERKYAGTLRPRPNPKPKAPPSEEKKKDLKKNIVISDPNAQRERVVELYDEYMRLNLLLGSRKMANFAKFSSFINNQTQKIRTNKGVDKVQYEVMVQDQKVVIKSKSVKK